MRKTLNVDDLVSQINHMLLNSSHPSEDFLEGLCATAETVLQMSDRYDGFRYIRDDESPYGANACGIIYESNLTDHTIVNRYRRQYLVKQLK